MRTGDPHLRKECGSPNPLISTRSISSSPSCFSAVSPVSQGLGLLLGTWVGKMLLPRVLPPPGSGEPHGTCLPAAENRTLHWKTERKEESSFKMTHTALSSCYPEHTKTGPWDQVLSYWGPSTCMALKELSHLTDSPFPTH